MSLPDYSTLPSAVPGAQGEHTGFVILDGAGEFLGWSACVVAAVRRSREIPKADRVERCSDGALIAYAPRNRRAPGAPS